MYNIYASHRVQAALYTSATRRVRNIALLRTTATDHNQRRYVTNRIKISSRWRRDVSIHCPDFQQIELTVTRGDYTRRIGKKETSVPRFNGIFLK